MGGKNLVKNVIEFYAVIGIPLIYGYGLWLVAYGEKMNLPEWVRLVGIVGAVGGIVGWVVSYVHLGRSFGILPQEQERVRRGIYQYISHPMYKSIMLTYLGLATANESFDGAWYSVLVLLPLLYIRTRLEEKKLR